MSVARLLPLAFLAISSARSAAVNNARRQDCDAWTIDGTSGFTERIFLDFSQYGPSDNVAEILDSHGFYISGYPVDQDPENPNDIDRIFLPENVYFGNGVLNMRVNAYSGSGPIESAEIATYTKELFGSAHVVWQSSSTPGVCEGSFFYESGSQETDIEILTSTIDRASPQVPAGWWATNQALNGNPDDKTSQVVPFTFNPRTGFHEYRIDWVPGSTTFKVDGVQKARHTTNVPNVPAAYIFNAWSNGDPFWSAGPPSQNSITKVLSIDLYRGYVGQVSGNVCWI